MPSAIYRHAVPVDDSWHILRLTGDILHVDTRNPRIVEIWALHTDGPAVPRSFRVYGTGQPLPEDVTYRGTVLTGGGGLVWHLMEQTT